MSNIFRNRLVTFKNFAVDFNKRNSLKTKGLIRTLHALIILGGTTISTEVSTVYVLTHFWWEQLHIITKHCGSVTCPW